MQGEVEEDGERTGNEDHRGSQLPVSAQSFRKMYRAFVLVFFNLNLNSCSCRGTSLWPNSFLSFCMYQSYNCKWSGKNLKCLNTCRCSQLFSHGPTLQRKGKMFGQTNLYWPIFPPPHCQVCPYSLSVTKLWNECRAGIKPAPAGSQPVMWGHAVPFQHFHYPEWLSSSLPADVC